MDGQIQEKRKTAKERTMEAFISLCHVSGLDSITVQEIVEAAKVSRPTFYKYFVDKSDLVWQTFLFCFPKAFLSSDHFLNAEEVSKGFSQSSMIFFYPIVCSSSYEAMINKCFLGYLYGKIERYLLGKGADVKSPLIKKAIRLLCYECFDDFVNVVQNKNEAKDASLSSNWHIIPTIINDFFDKHFQSSVFLKI